MPATRSQTIPAASRRTIGAALGLVLVVAAAPFLRPASAAQPTTDATASFETTPVAATAGVKSNDPAVWVNPTDPAKSLILGANDDGLAAYDLAGVKQAQAAIPATAPAMSSVDTRNNVTVAGAPASVAMSVGAGAARIYTIDPANGKLADKTATSAMTPAWHVGSISTVCMYQSPLTHNSYGFVMSGNGHMVQYQLIDDAVA
ncbi:MAG TPA: phytase, partial [Acidimicrobiia bacterium]